MEKFIQSELEKHGKLNHFLTRKFIFVRQRYVNLHPRMGLEIELIVIIFWLNKCGNDLRRLLSFVGLKWYSIVYRDLCPILAVTSEILTIFVRVGTVCPKRTFEMHRILGI